MKIKLDYALELARWLEGECKPYAIHIGLTGSVLYRGESANDLDLIAYPHNDAKPCTRDEIADRVIKIWQEAGCTTFLLTSNNPDYPITRQIVRVLLVDAGETIRMDIFVLE